MNNMYLDPLFTQGLTHTFSEIYENVDEFITDYKEIGIQQMISDTSVRNLYFLLYGKYANNFIANMDINQFKYKLFSIIFMYGPSWEKRLGLQKQIRDLTQEELMRGNTVINNIALNPDSAPTTASLDALPMISQQNASNQKRGSLEALAVQYNHIVTDVTEEFLAEFKKLFRKHVGLTQLLYKNYVEDDE